MALITTLSGTFRTLSTYPGLSRALLAALAGWLFPLAMAPYHYSIAIPVAVVLLLIALRGGDPDQQRRFRNGLLIGWFFGLGLFGNGVSWVYVSIHDYGYTGAPLALLLTLLFVMGLSGFTALQCATYQRFFIQTSPVWTFPAVWVLFEWLRSWLLTGFPWLLAGTALTDSSLSVWLPVGGVYLGSFLLVMTGALLFQWMRQQLRLRTLIAWLVMMFVGSAALSRVSWVEPIDGKTLEVAMVQGNIDQHEKWQARHQQRFLQLYHTLSQDVQSADLLLWPETAVPLLYRYSDSYFNRVLQDLPEGIALISGIPQKAESSPQDQARFYNSILVRGDGYGLYQKQKLVPFGEYLPLEHWLRGLIRFFNLPMSSFIAGPPDQPMLQAKGWQLAPFICYEIVYPDFVRRSALNSDLMITISNDSWFGASVGPLQHLQIAQTRALENGRYLLRGTNNGITAIIDPYGKIQNRGPQFEPAIIRGEVRAMFGQTPYQRLGSYPILLISALLLLVATIQSLPRRRMHTSV